MKTSEDVLSDLLHTLTTKMAKMSTELFMIKTELSAVLRTNARYKEADWKACFEVTEETIGKIVVRIQATLESVESNWKVCK